MPKKTILRRALYDRRSRFDRRKVSNMSRKEKRSNIDRRFVLDDRRTGWIRDSRWSSVFVDLLR